MRTISVAVSNADYEHYKRAAREREGSAAQLIREAMAFYRAQVLDQRPRLESIPVFVGHRPQGLPATRSEVYDEMFDPASEP